MTEKVAAPKKEESKTVFANKPKLFGKWNYDEVNFEKNSSFTDYIAISSTKS